jgi:hypothetical protein
MNQHRTLIAIADRARDRGVGAAQREDDGDRAGRSSGRHSMARSSAEDVASASAEPDMLFGHACPLVTAGSEITWIETICRMRVSCEACEVVSRRCRRQPFDAELVDDMSAKSGRARVARPARRRRPRPACRGGRPPPSGRSRGLRRPRPGWSSRHGRRAAGTGCIAVAGREQRSRRCGARALWRDACPTF